MNSPLSYFKEIYTNLRFSKEGGLKETVIRGAAGTFVLKIINKLLAFIVSLILARSLDVSGYGAYSYILSIIALLSIPSILGMDRLLIRDVASYCTLKKWGLIKGLLRWTNSLVIILSLIIVTLAGLIAVIFFKSDSILIIPAFLIALFIIPFNGLIRLRQTALQGLQKVIAGLLPELLIQPAIFITLLICTYFLFKYPPEVNSAILMNFLSIVSGFLIGTYFLRKNLPPEIKVVEPAYKRTEWLKTMLPFFGIAIIQIINQRSGVVLLGAMKGTHEVGIYSVAERLAELITFILIAINQPMAPVISGLYASNERERLQRIITKIVRILFLTSLPVLLIFIFFGKWLLLIFGKGFVEGYTALVILSIGQFINVSMGPVGLLLTMTGNEGYALRGFALSAMVNVILNILLIPPFGANGTALAGAVTIVTWNVVLAIFVYKKVGIRVW